MDRGKILPENGVVDMTSTIELDGVLQLDHRGRVTILYSLMEKLQRLIVIGNISQMVLLVMNLHYLAANKRLKGVIVVREIRIGVEDNSYWVTK